VATSLALTARGDLAGVLELAERHRSVLSHYVLLATQPLGQQLQQRGFNVEYLQPAAEGGDLEIVAAVLDGRVAGVGMFVGSAETDTHASGTGSLLQACAIAGVPLAPNLPTAELLLRELATRRNVYLIFNPVAGRGNPDRELELIRARFRPHARLHVVSTRADIDPVGQARECVAAIQNSTETEPGFIIASGGDGTVSAVASALIATDIPLGIIPRGTANAFATALGIPTNLRDACQTILAGRSRAVDVAYCNDVPTILLAGLGFEAGMVARAKRELKDRLGTLAYVVAGAQQLVEQEQFRAYIEIDGQVTELEASAITVANVAPSTSLLAQGFGQVIPNDGLLDITIATSKTVLEGVNTLSSLFASAVAKQPVQRPDLLCLRARSVKVDADPVQRLVVDGEMVGTTPVEFRCAPSALNVLVPLAAP